MLYLNRSATWWRDTLLNLTLTSVVFEFISAFITYVIIIDLTLTSVVFEYSVEEMKASNKVNLTLTSVVFEYNILNIFEQKK